ncbi:MAG: AAA family ATPase [Flavobacteriaceae bacterium]
MNFYSILKKNFPFDPTSKQDIFFQQISDFVEKSSRYDIFILKGYAGTGKTTIISTVVNHLNLIGKKSVLLAPTGRAAKVISNYSGKTAFTIHKKIYFPNLKGGNVSFTLQQNKHKNTLFIVDEASMISDTSTDSKLFENGSLLDDLISYIYSGENCKLILIGDTAQLPPVHLTISPALSEDTLGLQYAKEIRHIELDEVMRQEEGSGILHNATQIRELLKEDYSTDFHFDLNGFKDIVRLSNGYDIQDAIFDAYDKNGVEETSFIVRSNKRANQYNQQIRKAILGRESELSVGDLMMVVKNNYFWLKPTEEAGFIANGDIVEVLEIFKIQELYGFQFAKVKIQMIDYPNQKPFETVLLLDTIHSETPALTFEQQNHLYQEVMADYQDEKASYKKYKKVKENEYFNALQVKFSYAVTCHKAQGGQWNTVFIERPYLPTGQDRDYLRWLYTALTRAKEKVYLIGFKDEDFDLD